MKKYCMRNVLLFTILLIASRSAPVFALEVDVDEIRTKRVEFINYQGTYIKADPISAVEGIGKELSRGGDNERIRFYMKYSIIRAISKDEPDKFSADIFSIDKDARVGHIDVVRRITTAYLFSRYGYSRKNARAISLFLSYYNAVHRGDLVYFGSKYKSTVMKHIGNRNAGISTRYWEWPGATKMLIPLTENAVEPDLLSDKKTIEQLRKDDKNLPHRKDMADIKDRILEKDKKQLEEEKKKLEKEKQIIQEEKKPVEKMKEETKKKEEELKKAKEEIKKIQEPDKRKEKEDDIIKKETKIEEEKKETKKKEEEIRKKEEDSKKEEKKISDQEKKIVKREESLQEEKKQIERDEIKRDIAKEPETAKIKLEEKEKELDKREDKLRAKELDKSIYADKLYYLKIKEYLEGGHYNNEMYMINASTRKIMFKSPVENVCGSRYDIFSGGVVPCAACK